MKKLLYFEKHRKATWLELFFDLVFVVMIGKVTHLLAHTHNGHLELDYIIKFPLLFIPVWWLWINHTIYSNLYDRDTKEDRFITLIFMLLMVLLSVFIDVDFERVYPGFITLFSGMRFIISIQYLRSTHKHENNAKYASMLGKVYLFNTLVGLTSVLLTSYLRYSMVYLSIFLDFVLPIICGKKLSHAKIHKGHLVERIGLLTIILLGESVISIVNSISGIEFNSYNTLAMVSGFILIGGIWWILFDFFYLLEESERIIKPYILIFPNLFMHMGLAIIANVIRHGILNDLNISQYKIMTLIGIIVFFFGKQIPYLYVAPKIRKNVIQNTLIVFILTTCTLFLNRVEYILIGITVILFIYIALTFRYMIYLNVATKHIKNKNK